MIKATKWFGPLSGLLFAVLAAIGMGIAGGHTTEPTDAASVALLDLADNADKARIGSIVLMFALAFFLFFVAYLLEHFRLNEGGWWANAFFAGSVVLTSSLVAMTVLELGGAVAAENGDAEIAKAVIDLGWEVAITWAPALLVMGVAAAVMILGQRALPQWLGWFAVVVALGALMPWIGVIVFVAWVLAVSVVQLLAARRTDASPS